MYYDPWIRNDIYFMHLLGLHNLILNADDLKKVEIILKFLIYELLTLNLVISESLFSILKNQLTQVSQTSPEISHFPQNEERHSPIFQ